MPKILFWIPLVLVTACTGPAANEATTEGPQGAQDTTDDAKKLAIDIKNRLSSVRKNCGELNQKAAGWAELTPLAKDNPEAITKKNSISQSNDRRR